MKKKKAAEEGIHRRPRSWIEEMDWEK